MSHSVRISWQKLTLSREDAEADASEAAQLEAIENTFTHIQNQEAAKVKHPDARKRDLYVIEVSQKSSEVLTKQSYDVLPDDNFGEVSYVMFRFPDRPSSVTTALVSISSRLLSSLSTN